MCFFFFKQKTAYEMRISDWSSDVCSSDLGAQREGAAELVAVEIDAIVARFLHLLIVAAGQVARLELQLDLLSREHQPLAGDEVERETGLFPEVRLARRAAAGDARAGIGEEQRLLRQPVGILQPDLDVDEMVRLDRKSTRLNSSHKCEYR